jgi:microcystin-dependent protein
MEDRKQSKIRMKRLTVWGGLAAIAVTGAGAIVYAAVPHSFQTGETLTADNLNGNFNALDARLAALENALPPGTVVAFGGPAKAATATDGGAAATAPAGWLVCDGSAVSRTTYAGLFAAIGINFGGGDGIATFNLPDLRGRFVRGWDNGAGRDPDATTRAASAAGGPTGDAVGTFQGDAFRAHNHNGATAPTDLSHTHTMPTQAGLAQGGTGFTGQMYSANSGQAASTMTTSGASLNMNHTHTIATNGGNETRPANVTLNYIIKY